MISDMLLTLRPTRTVVFGVLFLAFSSRTDGLAISYCSPDLTAGSFQAVYNQYQTNGACQTTCQGSYAFAVLQGQNCWCSDYIPADQVSTYSCNTVCPGYGSEWCGSVDQDLYGYYALEVAPSGTAGGASPTSVASSAVSSAVASAVTSAVSSAVHSSPVSEPPSSAGSSITASSVSSVGDSSSLTVTATPQSSNRPSRTSSVPVVVSDPVTSSTVISSAATTRAATITQPITVITTVNSQVSTVIITPTPSSDSTIGSGTVINSSSGGVSTGKVVGIVVGVALGLGLLIGLGVWFWFRRRHQRALGITPLDESSSTMTSRTTGIPSRQVSQLSSAGLLSKAPRIQTSGFPPSSNPRSADTYGSNFDRRSVATDQRLNPYAIYAHDESRHSNVSLQDNQDYSRQLRVANPDP